MRARKAGDGEIFPEARGQATSGREALVSAFYWPSADCLDLHTLMATSIGHTRRESEER